MSERKYFSIVTDIGTAAMAKAVQAGKKVDAVSFAVGDGAGMPYIPTTDMTALKNEVWRGDITNYEELAQSPNVIRIDTLLPSDVGGFTIREMGIFDKQNRLIIVANTADVAKVRAIEGMQTEIALSISVALTNKKALGFLIDSNLVYASKKDLQRLIQQRNIVIPSTGWKEVAEGGEGGVTIDVIQENVTETMIPIVSILHSDMSIARKCGLSTSAETVNGAIQFFANKAPEKEMRASLVLLKASNGIGGDITENGNGMNIEAFYRDYVATKEDIKPIIDELKK